MKKLYENKPVLFAVLFIVLYCTVTIPIRGEYGDGSIQSLLGLCQGLLKFGELCFYRSQDLPDFICPLLDSHCLESHLQ